MRGWLRTAVGKAEGLHSEISKIMDKAPEKVAERVALLEAYAEAATFRLQAKDVRDSFHLPPFPTKLTGSPCSCWSGWSRRWAVGWVRWRRRRP